MAARHTAYEHAHHLRIAGGVLVGVGTLPLVLGAMALPTVWQRSFEGGTLDPLVIGVFTVGVVCELIGIPVLAVGLTGPMHPPDAFSASLPPSPALEPRRMGLGWAF
jgi:hypothetical protein